MVRCSLAVIGGCLALVLLLLGLLTRGRSLGVPEKPSGLEEPPSAAQADYASAWEDHLRVVDQALQEGSIRAAVRAWDEAYSAALGSRGWEGMIAVGDAMLEIGKASTAPNEARAKARGAYLTALGRARDDRSVDGMLRAAEAFGGLGDRSVVEQCLRVAESLAVNDPEASRRVHESRSRWTATEDNGREGERARTESITAR